MFPSWGHIICLLSAAAAARAMAVRRVRPAAGPRKADFDSGEASGEEWGQVFRRSAPWNDSALLPTSVYDFQTGEVSFFNWDLNGSAANHFPKAQKYPSSPVPLQVVGEGKPRRYSAKYAKEDEGILDENYEILKEPKSAESAEESVREEKDGLQKQENEQYEVYEQHKQPVVLDNEKAESGHESKKPTSSKHSEGSGQEHHEDHHNKKKTKGLKDYKGEHHYHKGEKGHHDKEGHKGQYSDKKGSTKSHKEGGGHFEAGVHGEKGQKESKHSDKEEYKKGHSTRGGHVVHKKDEYEKKHEFYDEHHEGGDSEKHGEYFEEHHAKSGGHKKGGHKQGEGSGHHKAKKGHYEKGRKFHEQKGHKKAGGHEKKHEHDDKHGKKHAHSDWKKFGYESGKGGDKGGDSGGAHSNVGHLLVAPPAPTSGQTFVQNHLPEFVNRGSEVGGRPVLPSGQPFGQNRLPEFPDEDGGTGNLPIVPSGQTIVQNRLPEFLDQGVKETKQLKKKPEEEKPSKTTLEAILNETRPLKFEESAPVPSTELKPPPPFSAPKITISRFKFPPAENS